MFCDVSCLNLPHSTVQYFPKTQSITLKCLHITGKDIETVKTANVSQKSYLFHYFGAVERITPAPYLAAIVCPVCQCDI